MFNQVEKSWNAASPSVSLSSSAKKELGKIDTSMLRSLACKRQDRKMREGGKWQTESKLGEDKVKMCVGVALPGRFIVLDRIRERGGVFMAAE